MDFIPQKYNIRISSAITFYAFYMHSIFTFKNVYIQITAPGYKYKAECQKFWVLNKRSNKAKGSSTAKYESDRK